MEISDQETKLMHCLANDNAGGKSEQTSEVVSVVDISTFLLLARYVPNVVKRSI